MRPIRRRALRDVPARARSRQALRHENAALKGKVRDLAAALERAQMQAEAERERVETLLHDTSHRIGNSLATVSSLLGLQLLRSTSEEVKQALEAARSRVHAVAAAHRRLRLGDGQETASADEFLQPLLQELAKTTASGQRVALVSEVDAIPISARDATTLGILIGELVSNALRHGFPDGRVGHIMVRLQRDRVGIATLSVIDDGVGIAKQGAVGEGGLGSVIVKQLALQFGGVPEYEHCRDGGLAVRVPLPSIAAEPPAA